MKEAGWVLACGFCISDLRAKVVVIHPLTDEERATLERSQQRAQTPPQQPHRTRWRDLRRGLDMDTTPPKFGALWPRMGLRKD